MFYIILIASPLIVIIGIRNLILSRSAPARLRLLEAELHLPIGLTLRRTVVIQYQEITSLEDSIPESSDGHELSIGLGNKKTYRIKESHLKTDGDYVDMLKLLRRKVDDVRVGFAR